MWDISETSLGHVWDISGTSPCKNRIEARLDYKGCPDQTGKLRLACNPFQYLTAKMTEPVSSEDLPDFLLQAGLAIKRRSKERSCIV
jgi:hypothetical protein